MLRAAFNTFFYISHKFRCLEYILENDIISVLRDKETEMEARIEEAKKKAATIREEAAVKAREIKAGSSREIEDSMEPVRRSGEEAIRMEVERVSREAEEAAKELRTKALERRAAAVDLITTFVLEGVGVNKP